MSAKFSSPLAAVALMVGAGTAAAAVDDEQAARLGESLTPMGAEPAGNEAGTIPEWRGGLHRPDAPNAQKNPYADDEVRFTITADNLDDHRDHLTPGQEAVFEAYPGYRMKVYPTRRSAAYPEHVYEATQRNATRARLAGRVDALRGAATGFPFPIPQSGPEVIWNHKLRWRTPGYTQFDAVAVVTEGGEYRLMRRDTRYRVPYMGRDFEPEGLAQKQLFRFQMDTVAPSSMAGEGFLMYEPFDPERGSRRRVWIYAPGERRVRSVSGVEFDQVSQGVDGLRTVDQIDVFNGSLAKYDWELVGKREIYIPYNAYRLDSRALEYEDIVQAHHINQDLARYELHRVWVVDARLREDAEHRYPRRTFYVDEDSWQIALVDVYDDDGAIRQLQEGHAKAYYQVPLTYFALITLYDLSSGRYVVSLMDNEEEAKQWDVDLSRSRFTPGALRRGGQR